jgi:precorrin-6B C5,15-methyltransferase / cobalt-precorrin-6B C5,C15-methyltransferase
VLWDVGAGSGSVGIECARLRPGLRVIAIERDPASAQRVRANVTTHGVAVQLSVSRAAPVPGAGVRLAAENPVFVCWGPRV